MCGKIYEGCHVQLLESLFAASMTPAFAKVWIQFLGIQPDNVIKPRPKTNLTSACKIYKTLNMCITQRRASISDRNVQAFRR